MNDPDRPVEMTIRLDKWLWAARFFKSRGLAAEAVSGGLVRWQGARTKPAKSVRIGDEIAVRRGTDQVCVVVRGLADRRGPATAAARLYEETEESRRGRELAAATRRAEAAERPRPGRRPTKKERRDLRALRRE